MRKVREYIARKQLDFARHAFFVRLRNEERYEEGLRFVP